MPDDTYNIRQASRASGLGSPLRLEQWISRGYFRPEDTPPPGKPRSYGLIDILRLAVLVELTRLGFDPKHIAPYSSRWPLHGWKNAPAVLVIWQGMGQLIQTRQRGEPALKEGSGKRFYSPNLPLRTEIVRPDEIREMVLDPDNRALAIINLDHVERRVKEALPKLDPLGWE